MVAGPAINILLCSLRRPLYKGDSVDLEKLTAVLRENGYLNGDWINHVAHNNLLICNEWDCELTASTSY